MAEKLVRKLPTVKTMSHKKIKSTMYVKSGTPFKSATKRIDKLLNQCQRYVTVLGMGHSVTKTLAIATTYQEKLHKVQVMTKTIEVLDEVVEDTESIDDSDSDIETKLKKRLLSGVEVRIFKV
ncbi:uncharacterized protein GVI51_M05995 [Nakaseomyces glabratus]|uniref:Uncharacterized protein n=2 Tax=Candida glabrata TaxID=5478 RepID=Q6FJI5_CANGA|nr:uncharacterized protein CAGL0M06039g [Nakaseomyces glabratus]KAH7578922.1 Rpp20 subunit of nuclear RNase MRP and P [Nakaseomyces glabratus]KAH7580169.1 Rpp20 subunit of nuclear RNase MRP and P [Nakaseomyces glabratus]KAH7593793.1 Rpp20 subunit of nuclear RNase MRP and P [Nakaseomyces glabratus]KAH7600244.1 Rpp20 subunit of nuclear RNase MRP and P [Nakaseomyces glabratus]KAI8381882.1 Rpp20 subunit of nuclear RNase MRP and P [Nakaseomyces glabratus]|eukprot:XP_449609.1 uncharacterized protein CAGL0M06039g [[Candida] glabrata]